jgi:hypothetical protein
MRMLNALRQTLWAVFRAEGYHSCPGLQCSHHCEHKVGRVLAENGYPFTALQTPLQEHTGAALHFPASRRVSDGLDIAVTCKGR